MFGSIVVAYSEQPSKNVKAVGTECVKIPIDCKFVIDSVCVPDLILGNTKKNLQGALPHNASFS